MTTQLGSSLIEILISFLLLSTLLLGLDAMQLVSLRASVTAYYYATAVQQTRNIVERLAVLSSFSHEEQLLLWNQQNSEVLPQGRGVVRDNTVILHWGRNAGEECNENKLGHTGCIRGHF